MRKVYRVTLTAEEREQLLTLTHKGTSSARTVRRAYTLLQAADGASDAAIARALQVDHTTVERTRKRFVEGGLDRALYDRQRPGARRKLDEPAEAWLVALACSQPPTGQARWTMQALAGELVRLEKVESISDETVRRTLKKTR